MEAKDPGTRAHLQRTHDDAVALTQAVAPELAADQRLRYGFLLHDVGKVGIPEAVLNKAGPLDDGEREVMRAHPLRGGRHLPGDRARPARSARLVAWGDRARGPLASAAAPD